MKIDKKTHILTKNNFINQKSEKKKIVLVNSFSRDMKFFNGWLLRRNKNYKKVTPYTVDRDGTIYEHYDPKYHSTFLKLDSLDKETIPITIVNQGWLKKDSLTNKYKDWVGNIYKGDDVVNKEWRGHYMWAPYTKKQMESVGNLVDYLCENYKIERNSLSHNVMFEHAPSFNGVLSRSNFSRRYTDISPSFRFEYIDNKLLKEETNE
jgi:N-acetyl-anhydromuramyl-L-alanine amidase AmpD